MAQQKSSLIGIEDSLRVEVTVQCDQLLGPGRAGVLVQNRHKARHAGTAGVTSGHDEQRSTG